MEFVDSNRHPFTNFLARLCSFGAVFLSIYMAGMAIGHHAISFSVRSASGRLLADPSFSTVILLFAGGFQLLAHLARVGVLAVRRLMGRPLGDGFSDAAMMAGILGLTALMFYSPALLIWLYSEFGQWTLANTWLPMAFLVLSLVSFLILHFDWNYEIYPRQSRKKVPASGGSVEAPDAPVSPIAAITPSLTFKDIYGNSDLKHRLLQAGRGIVSRAAKGEARNGILLTGNPGNGKTAMAEALAGELSLSFFKLTHSDVASQWVGERTVRIKATFDQAIRSQPSLLFIDEIDSFIPDRGAQASQVKEDTDVVNALLTLLVDVRRHKVVVVAASNYLDRLDGAAVREGRFDFKIEITPPDLEGRLGLIRHGLARHAPAFQAADSAVLSVALRWNGFSVKRILAVTEELPGYLASLDRTSGEIQFEDFMGALRRIQGRAGSVPENTIPLHELVLPSSARESFLMIAQRMRDPLKVESLGGSLPTGILLSGPAGTGKTSACKALVKEVGWAFLPTTGAELARDPRALQNIYDKAKDLRPTIIFIDEADDLLRSREYSHHTEATNKLLSLMDGASDRVSDVVWVAATNHPDSIDPALLRGGRFTEKVAFTLPSIKQLIAHTGQWIATRKINLESGVHAEAIVSLVGEQSIANLEAILQNALNRAIGRISHDRPLTISRSDLLEARLSVCGA